MALGGSGDVGPARGAPAWRAGAPVRPGGCPTGARVRRGPSLLRPAPPHKGASSAFVILSDLKG